MSTCTALSTVGFVPLTRGLIAIVDADDLPKLSTFGWVAHAGCRGRGYPYAKSGAAGYAAGLRMMSMHRFLTGDRCAEIDHWSGYQLDNRKQNLRTATRQQNCRNTPKRPSCISTFKGVRKRRRRWQSRIWVDNKATSLGNFRSEEDAARAYDMAALKLFGEFARTNFPRSDYAPQSVTGSEPDGVLSETA